MTPSWNRRAVLRGGAYTAGAAAVTALAVSAAEPATAAAPVGPWTYVAPGESIQAAIDAGAKAIMLGDGQYNIAAPIVAASGCTIRGIGQRTRLVATTAMIQMMAIGNGGPADSVHIGDLSLECAGRASIGIDLNIVGTTGFYQGEPDSVCRLDNIRVYQPAQDGVVYQGSDTQACITNRVRVRRAGRYGFRVEAPDNWWTDCEATTSTQTGSSAGFYVGGANNYFTACKAWYCRDYGWHIKGTRNKFTACESQDTRSHGWYIEWDKNVFNGCVADTAAMYDVGGVANTADGFYVAAAAATSLVGCQAFDRRPGGAAAAQRYGFNVPASMVSGGRLVAPTGWDNTGALVNQR